MEPLVSIIIPVYNGSNFVSEAIESALSQTYKNIEVIVINDGSTDGGKTREKCSHYFSRIRYFEKENGGVASAINYGIRKMEGEYFAWLSHDDLFKKEKIERQMREILNNDDQDCVCFSNFELFNTEVGESYLFDIKSYCDESNIEKGIYPILFGLIHFCTVIVSKKRIEEVGNCNEELQTTQDIEWLFRLLRGKKNLFLDEPLTIVRAHDQQGKKTIKEYSAEQSKAHISFVERINDNEIKELFGDRRTYYCQMALFYCKDNNKMAYDYVREKYNSSPITANEVEKRDRAQKEMQVLEKNGKLVVFCAGKFGKELVFELALKGIKVDYMSDNNGEKWGTECLGLKIISPNELKKNECIVVAKNNPDDVIDELVNIGFKNIVSYLCVKKIVSNVLPCVLPSWEELNEVG